MSGRFELHRQCTKLEGRGVWLTSLNIHFRACHRTSFSYIRHGTRLLHADLLAPPCIGFISPGLTGVVPRGRLAEELRMEAAWIICAPTTSTWFSSSRNSQNSSSSISGTQGSTLNSITRDLQVNFEQTIRSSRLKVSRTGMDCSVEVPRTAGRTGIYEVRWRT